MSESEFRKHLLEFSLEELRYMFWIVRTDGAIGYYDAHMAEVYRDAIYDRLVKLALEGYEW